MANDVSLNVNENEAACKVGDFYLAVQKTDEGYDYTIYDKDFVSKDGGVYDGYESMGEVIVDIAGELNTLQEKKHEIELVDYDALTENSFELIRERQPERIRAEKEKELDEPKKEPERNLDRDFIIIWQRDDNYAFCNSDFLKRRNVELERSDFKPVFTAKFNGQSLDDIYDEYQRDNNPKGYEARSVSTGDIITINRDGENKDYFVDDVGFKEISDFSKETYLVNGIIFDKEQMTENEVARFEDYFGKDINSDAKIGEERKAENIEDRDLNGNGYADKYDYELER